MLAGSACCEPSSSTISMASSHKKSAMKRPHGTCRRNFSPLSRRSRSRAHNVRSSSVCRRRSPRATCVNRSVISLTHSHVTPSRSPSPVASSRRQAPHRRDILSRSGRGKLSITPRRTVRDPRGAFSVPFLAVRAARISRRARRCGRCDRASSRSSRRGC